MSRHPGSETTGGEPVTSGYVPNIHPDVMRSIPQQIVDTGDVIGPAGPGQTILAVTVDDWLIDELAALGSDVTYREPEPVEDNGRLSADWRPTRA